MPDFFLDALPFVPLTLIPAVFVLLFPFVGRRARTTFAVLLVVIAALFLVDIAVLDHTGVHTLDVPNLFPDPETGKPKVWIVAQASEPAWAWHVVVSVWFGVFGAFLLARRGVSSGPRSPVLLGTVLFLAYLAVRLALEKTAAPVEVVWATGASVVLVAMLPFLGWHAGARGLSFGKWAGALLLMAFLQRLPVIVFAYVATTRQLGTHLDTHLVTGLGGPFGRQDFGGDPVRAWVGTTLVPHATFWVVLTVALGLLLGSVPWWRGRRRTRAAAPASA
jgi:hypothetical protein